MVDFYNWGYEYGHDLDPHAIIKIPGESYQPPLFGTKQLLNFTAHSWPDAGAVIVVISIILACTAWYVASPKKKKSREAAME